MLGKCLMLNYAAILISCITGLAHPSASVYLFRTCLLTQNETASKTRNWCKCSPEAEVTGVSKLL